MANIIKWTKQEKKTLLKGIQLLELANDSLKLTAPFNDAKTYIQCAYRLEEIKKRITFLPVYAGKNPDPDEREI